jgi:hypothetical protein
MITAEFIGGPFDGRQIALPCPTHLELAMQASIDVNDDRTLLHHLKRVRVPVQLTVNGYRLMWADRFVV